MAKWGSKGKRVAIYLRVSTSEQTTANQRRELEAVAARHEWNVVAVFEDAGISGTKGRDQRPGLDAMMKAVALREIDMVVAWSVDRLGRSLIDLLDLLRELHAKGVDLFLHRQGLDTSTPAGRAMFQMMGVFAEFERAMIRERVLAGLSRAREQG
jgi:DNA invertase Pin-like site-specific DNA recombinase